MAATRPFVEVSLCRGEFLGDTGAHKVQQPANRSSPTVREGSSISNEALLESRATAPNAQADVNEKAASGFLGVTPLRILPV